jgi:simple sugar transport system substrate-binding protein
MKQSLNLLAACLALLTANASAADLTIGFIYVGPKDYYGYNQAHALGATSVAVPKNSVLPLWRVLHSG